MSSFFVFCKECCHCVRAEAVARKGHAARCGGIFGLVSLWSSRCFHEQIEDEHRPYRICDSLHSTGRCSAGKSDALRLYRREIDALYELGDATLVPVVESR